MKLARQKSQVQSFSLFNQSFERALECVQRDYVTFTLKRDFTELWRDIKESVDIRVVFSWFAKQSIGSIGYQTIVEQDFGA